MRITSLGYSPINQSTKNRNQMQNPAFNGKMVILTENLAEVVGHGKRAGEESFRAIVGDAQETLAGLGDAVMPVFESMMPMKKAIMRVPDSVDAAAAEVCRGYQAKCDSGVLKGVKFDYVVEPQGAKNATSGARISYTAG